MAIRWASDRIGEQGIVAFVTNGSWIDGNADSGVRACLAKEFNTIYVLNLRGNQRTQGERSHMEGGKIFGQGSRAPVAITILVRNPNANRESCQILYHDIGDYLKREEKLSKLQEAGSVSGINWHEITPDKHHDWIGQRDEAFEKLYPMGSKDAKAGRPMTLYSSCSAMVTKPVEMPIFTIFPARPALRMPAPWWMITWGALQELSAGNQGSLKLDDIVERHSSNVRWDLSFKE